MKIAVWRTGHEIADMVARAIIVGDHRGNEIYFQDTRFIDEDIFQNMDAHIGYGILRGMDEVFRACDKAGKPWFNIDKGYWKSGHYDGYYRVSLRGTQQTFGLDKLKPDYERWDALGLEILPEKKRDMRHADPYRVYCPPTDAVRSFFNLGELGSEYVPVGGNKDWIMKWRGKHDRLAPLQEDLDKCEQLITFNSSVGWEALRQGIPVVSDPVHSIVGAYQKMVDKDLSKDYEERRRLFAVMASLQLTLEDMRQGLLWPLIQNLLSATSVMMDAKQ